MQDDLKSDGYTCGAETFGTEPPNVKQISSVAVVYAWVYCRRSNVDGTQTAELLPVAVHFGDPPTVDSAPDWANPISEIDRTFPPDVRDAARNQPAAVASMIARVDAAVSANPTR
jgi:hypothetical protein